MTGPEPRELYRPRDHIAGANWRPTLFAEAVPNIRICGLCHMIPKKIVILPCGHILCESCLRASAGDGSSICPLDVETAEDECSWSAFADKKAKDLKAHCWNQPHGCEFVGTMDAVLHHYEAECTFHAAECQRCGVPVLHNELAGHHVAGCRGDTSLPTTEGCDTVTISDIRAAKEELKAFVTDPHHDQLRILQGQMNQLVEQCRQDAMETRRLVAQSINDVKGEAARMASAAHEIHSRVGSQGEATFGSSGDGTSGESIRGPPKSC